MAFPACTNITPFRVSLRFVWFKFVGLAQTGQAIRVPIFLFFLYLHFYFLSCIIIDEWSFLIPQRVLSDLEEGYEKSMLTRTKPFLQLIVSKTPKVYNFFSKENAFLFAIYCNLLQFIATI